MMVLFGLLFSGLPQVALNHQLITQRLNPSDFSLKVGDETLKVA